jgi:hypothetical protein
LYPLEVLLVLETPTEMQEETDFGEMKILQKAKFLPLAVVVESPITEQVVLVEA